MAVNYATTVKTSRLNVVIAAIDAGAGAGYIEICSAAYAAVLATIVLSDPCGSTTGDVLTFTMPHSDTAADATGTAAIARIKDSNGVVVIQGLTVGTAATDIVLTSVAITINDPVTITAATITHAA